MDVEVFTRQVQEAQERLSSLLQQAQADPTSVEWTLEVAFAELSTTIEELSATVEQVRAQQQDLVASQQAIQEERQRYRDLFEFAPDGYLVTDERGMILEANQAAAALLNIESRFIAGLPLAVFVAQDDLAFLFERLQSVRRSQPGALQEWELPLQPRNGEPIEVWLRVTPILDRSQRVVGMRWLLRDPRPRQQMIESARLAAVLQHLPAGVVIAEAPSGRLLLSNAQAETILQGRLPLGERFVDFTYTGFHPDGRPYEPMEWPLARALWHAETVLDEEIDVVRGNGHSAIIRISAAPIRDERGEIVAAVATFYDLTEQRQAERTTQDSEARLRAILDSTNQSMTLLAPDYSIQAFNRIAADAAREVFGREMRIGGSMLDFVLSEHIADFKQHFHEALQGTSITIEKLIPGRTADWWEFQYYPIRLPSSEITGITFTARKITSRKRSEELLRESEERLRLALDAGQMGHWDWNILTGDVMWSPDHNRMLGLPIEQACGSYQQFIQRIHPDDAPLVTATLARSQAEHIPYEAEFRVIWPDNTIRWVAGSGRTFYENGRPTRMIGVVRDITERKQAEEELRTIHEQTSAILESISDAFYAVDKQWRFTYINHKAEELLGKARDELLGQKIWDAFPAALVGAAYTYHRQAMTERQLVEFEMVSPVSGGWIEGRIYPSAQGISVYFRDISERKRSELGLQLLAQASALLSASLDYETTLVQVAQLAVPTLADLCVVCIEEAEGESRRIEVAVADTIPAEQAAAIQRLTDAGWSWLMGLAVGREEPALIPDLPRAVQEMAAPEPEHQWLAQDLKLQSIMIMPLQVREHSLGALIIGAARSRRPYDSTDLAFASDLAYRIALAVDNARLYRDARSAISARDTFLSIASHELKTPLTSLIGYAYLLQRTPIEGPAAVARTRQAVDVIARQTQRLNHLIEDLLDLTRIQRGQWDLILQPLDIVPLISRAVEEARLTTQIHMIEWSATDNELIVNGDEGRLEQVIQNLLNNAVKYSSRGGRIHVALEAQDGLVRISVADQGIGIPQAAQSRLWEPFYRAANATKQSSGFGIGLFIVHEIVQRHSGTITVESAEGEGSTFTVTLPLLPSLS